MNPKRSTDFLIIGAGFSGLVAAEKALVEAGLQQAEAKGLLARDHQRIAPTALGRRFLNDLQQLFLD